MLNFGTQTGSLINHIMSGDTSMPEVGDGATMLAWTDRTPGTVIQIEAKGKFVYVAIQADDYVMKNEDGLGIHGSQDYSYSQNKDGHITYFRRSVDGGDWLQTVQSSITGRWQKRDGLRVRFGTRQRYYDPHF